MVTKRVSCTNCGEGLEVGPRAISGVCPHCNKRLVIEDLRIRAYHAVRKLATCGDVHVDESGHLVATVQAVNLTVMGRLSGDVRVSGRVSIGKTGSVTGDITAPSLQVENGAELWGQLHIG
jgi:cytoskeletal protein CcmA (bactofilin family)